MNNKPNFPEFGIEFRYIIKMPKEMATIYARLINQYELEFQTVFSSRFEKQDEDNQIRDEIGLYTNLKIKHNLT